MVICRYLKNKNLNLSFYGPVFHSRVFPVCSFFVFNYWNTCLQLMFHFKDVLKSYTLFHRDFWGKKTPRNKLCRNFCLLPRANVTFATIYFIFQSKARVMRCRLTALLSDQSPVNFHSFLLRCSPSLPEILGAPADGQGRASVSMSEPLPESCAAAFRL